MVARQVDISPAQLANPKKPPTPAERQAMKEQAELKMAVEMGKIKQVEMHGGEANDLMAATEAASSAFPDLAEVFTNPELPVMPAIAAAPVINEVPPLPPPPASKPPTTRAQYQAEQMAAQQDFPDVADLFLGKTGATPITGIVNPFEKLEKAHLQAQAAQAAPPQEVVVRHELPEQRMAYVFTEDTTAYVTDCTQYFPKGKVLYEDWQIRPILEGGCRTLVPIESAENFVTCPCGCNHSFPLQAAPGRYS